MSNESSSSTANEAESVQIDPSTWVDEYGDYLYRYAHSRLRDTNSAEEVVQETFLAGVRYAEQFSGRGTEQAWLLGILKRKIVDFVRRRAKHSGAQAYDDESDPSGLLFDEMGSWRPGAIGWAPTPDQKVQLDELWSIVKGCLESIPSRQADVFVLSVMEGLDSDEICRELEITSANFWVRMHRARLGLAKCVGTKWHQNDEVKQDV